MKWILMLFAFTAHAVEDFKVTQPYYVGLTEMVMHHWPDPSITNWYTWKTNHWWISGGNTNDHWFGLVIGEQTRLSWTSVPNKQYIIQYSTNLVTWHNVPITFIGSGQEIVWYDYAPIFGKLYRLYPPPIPGPFNLKSIK